MTGWEKRRELCARPANKCPSGWPGVRLRQPFLQKIADHRLALRQRGAVDAVHRADFLNAGRSRPNYSMLNGGVHLRFPNNLLSSPSDNVQFTDLLPVQVDGDPPAWRAAVAVFMHPAESQCRPFPLVLGRDAMTIGQPPDQFLAGVGGLDDGGLAPHHRAWIPLDA